MHVGGMPENPENPAVEEEEIPEEEIGVTVPPKVENAPAPSAENTSSPNDFNQNQVVGLVALVWIILIVSVMALIVSGTISSKKSKTKETAVDPVYNYTYAVLNSVQVEDASYKDYVTINKTILINDGNIVPAFCGKAENYKKNMVIPVSLSEYNSVQDKTRIEVVFSRLNISGEEKIIISSWSIA